jgi:hypothetical protein
MIGETNAICGATDSGKKLFEIHVSFQLTLIAAKNKVQKIT